MPIDTGTASDLDLLHRLNDDYIHSVVHRDVARFREILSDDFLCTNPDGTVIDKSQFLTQTAAPVSLTEFAVDDVRVRVFGDSAVIHGTTRFALKDGRRGRGQYTDVWQKQQGRWLAVAAHVMRAFE